MPTRHVVIDYSQSHIKSLATAAYLITVKKEGYVDYHGKIHVAEGERTRVVIELEKDNS